MGSSLLGSSSNDSSSHNRRRKRKDRKHSKEKKSKKHRKEKKTKSKKSHLKTSKLQRHRRDREDDFSASNSNSTSRNHYRDPRAAGYALADALCRLLDDHPAMAEDFPAILVQLASGTTLNLLHSPVQSRLTDVLRQLKPYGVYNNTSNNKDKDDDDTTGVWQFRALQPTKKDALVLIRVVRSLLDQIGVTMDAVQLKEDNNSLNNTQQPKSVVLTSITRSPSDLDQEIQNVKHETLQMIRSFGTTTTLAKELVSLCETILEGEIISLEGLPDHLLKVALHVLLHETCGMVPSEMDDDDDDDNEGEDEPTTTGLGLPDDEAVAPWVIQRIQAVRQVCSQQAERVTKGPLPRLAMDDTDDEDGPLLPGQMRRTFGEASAPAVSVLGAEGGREEWMLIPGKFDLLTGLKSGQPIRNRQFSGKRSADTSGTAIDPKIQEEIRALREEHEASRGPSLMEEHRLRKHAEAMQKKSMKVDWKWDRSTDLDAGRRVDNDALNMMLGGANANLREKFHSSM